MFDTKGGSSCPHSTILGMLRLIVTWWSRYTRYSFTERLSDNNRTIRENLKPTDWLEMLNNRF